MNRRIPVVLSILAVAIPLGIFLTWPNADTETSETADSFDYDTPPSRLVQPSSESSDLLARMRDDPRAFLAALQAVPVDDRVRVWAGSWITSHSKQRFGLERRMPESVRAQILFDGDIRDWLPADPNRSLQEARRFPMEDAPGRYAIACLAIWASHDPVTTSLWHRDHVARFPHPGMDLAAGEIAAQWCRQDAAAAGRWVHRLSDAARDQAAYAMATELMWIVPPEAAEWVDEVSDPKLHLAAVCQVALFWLHDDPGAAESWIRSDALTAAERELVRKHFELN